MNEPLLNFITSYWLSIIAITVLLIPLIPYEKLNLYGNKAVKSNGNIKIPIIIYIFHVISRSIFEIGFAWTLRGTISIVIFIILSVDLLYNHKLNTQSVVLIVISMLSLYLDKLVETGDEIKFFGVFLWKRDPSYKEKQDQPRGIDNNNDNTI